MTTYDLDELHDMAPFYVQETLSKAEKEAFEEGLQKYPELRDELETYSEIRSYYQGGKEKSLAPKESAFNAIQKNINRDHPRPVVGQRDRPALIELIRKWFEKLFTVPKIGWGIAAIQCVLIAFFLLPGQGDPCYETLSSSPAGIIKQITIQLVFDEKTTEKEIRRILTTINGEIRGGPSNEGLYQISLRKETDADAIVTELRAKKKILFAEKAL